MHLNFNFMRVLNQTPKAYAFRGVVVVAKSVHLKNAAILTATGLLLRAAGMIFRVYIAAEIGAAGIGLYQLIFTVYNLAVTLATAGLSAVTTRTVAALENRQNARHAMRVLLALSLFTGLCAASVLFFSAYPAALYWLGDARAAPSLKILAPSLPFMAVSAVLRGYYMAVRNVKPNAVAQIGEQAVRIGVVALLLMRVDTSDMSSACSAVVFGNTVSEVLSWVYMQACYNRTMRGIKPQKAKNEHILRDSVKRLLPMSANQYLTSALHTVENVLVPQTLAAFLGSSEAALEQYGALRGMAMPVMFFPFSIIVTVSTLLLPDVTQSWVKHDDAKLHILLSRILCITLAASIPSGVLFWLFAYDIGQVLYKSTEVGFFLLVLAPMTPMMYLESMVDGILKGIDKQSATFRYTIVDCAARIVLIWIFLPRYGMEGFLIIMLASNMFTGVLNVRCLLSATKLRMKVKDWIVKPLLLSLTAATAVWLLFIRSPYAATSLIVRTCTAGVAFVCIYIMLLLVFSPSLIYNKKKDDK